MSKSYLVSTVIIISLFISTCSNRKEEKDIVAQINDYYMSVEDFKQDIKVLLTYRPQSIKTPEDKIYILNDLINKEIILHEAQRLNLDKNKEFIRTIENYWKQTLFVALIKKKANEISDSVSVYDDEIKNYYEDLKSKNPELEPLAEIEREIKRLMRREKETAMMQKWLDDLREKSRIEINEEVLMGVEIK